MESVKKERSYYWDNVKVVLIFLVVLGHLLIPLLATTGRALHALFYFIYLFHMPAFVFCTGLFAKKLGGKKLANKLTGIMIVYILFVLLLWIVQRFVSHMDGYPLLFSSPSAPWYLLAFFNWTLLLQYVSEFKARTAIIIALCMSLCIGVEPEVGHFFAMSRTIVFFPFFMAGYFFENKQVPRIHISARILSAVVLLGIGIILFFNTNDLIETYYPVVYGGQSYQAMGFSVVEGVIARFVWYAIASLMMICMFCIIPTRKTKLTYIGSRTLGIFICHRLITEAIKATDIYSMCENLSGLENGVLFFCIAFIIMLICSIKPITSLFNYLLKKEYISQR